jgi:hypothetical protein
MIIRAKKFQQHPEGVFPAVLKSVSADRPEMARYEGEKEKPITTNEWTFETPEGEVTQKFTQSLHPNSTMVTQFRRWGVLPKNDADLPAELDPADLIGKACTVVVVHHYNFKMKRTWVRIEAIFPPGAAELSSAA